MRVRRRLAGEAADGGGEMAVGAWIVHGPVGAALFPTPKELHAAVARRYRRIHEAGKDPLGELIRIGRNRVVALFQAGIFAEGLLPGGGGSGVEGRDERRRGKNDGSGPAEGE